MVMINLINVDTVRNLIDQMADAQPIKFLNQP